MSVRMLVVSDTHYKIDNLYFAVDEAGEIDGLIHLGDIEDYRSEVEEMVDCPCYIVPGNNDYFSGMSRERILEIGDHRILLTHGHRYQPYFSRTMLMEAAEGEGCDIVRYGHTHVPMVEELISREEHPAPKVWLNPDVKDFYEFRVEDLHVEDYVTGPQIKNIPIAV